MGRGPFVTNERARPAARPVWALIVPEPRDEYDPPRGSAWTRQRRGNRTAFGAVFRALPGSAAERSTARTARSSQALRSLAVACAAPVLSNAEEPGEAAVDECYCRAPRFPGSVPDPLPLKRTD